ncbi:hypothetical protein D3C72_1694950 [compost metagenome]
MKKTMQPLSANQTMPGTQFRNHTSTIGSQPPMNRIVVRQQIRTIAAYSPSMNIM